MKFSNSIDFGVVRNIVNDVLDRAQSALKVPERRIGISSIEPDGYKVMVNVWLDAHGFVDNKMVIQEKLMEALKGSGLKLPGAELVHFLVSCRGRVIQTSDLVNVRQLTPNYFAVGVVVPLAKFPNVLFASE